MNILTIKEFFKTLWKNICVSVKKHAIPNQILLYTCSSRRCNETVKGGGWGVVGSFQLELNNIFIIPQRQLVRQMQSVCKRRIMEFPNRGSAKNSFIDSVSWDTPRALGRPRTNLWVGWGPAPAISWIIKTKL